MTIRSTVRSPEALGEALARLRYRRGLTQDELADAIGVSRRYIYDLESGKPTLYARRLFEILNLLDANVVVEAQEEVQ